MDRREWILSGASMAVPTSLWAAQESAKPDAALFFRRTQTNAVSLSPDGTRVALSTTAPHGRAILSVVDLATMTPTVIYSSEGADVDHFVWVNDQRLAFTMADLETPQGKQDAGPGLFAVDVDGSNYRQLVERQWVFSRNGAVSSRLQPWNTFLLGSTVLQRSDEVLVVRPEQIDKEGFDYIKLIRLNTKTLQSREIEGPLRAVAWTPDSSGELRVCVTREKEKAAVQWNDPESGQWRVLAEFNAFTEEPEFDVRFVGPNGSLYVTARRGEDKQALWQLNPRTKEWSKAPLAQSPHFDVNAHIVSTREKVLGYRFTIDAEVTQWVDADMAALQVAIDRVLPRTVNRLSVPYGAPGPWVLIEAFSDVQPSQFFVFNRETKKFARLGSRRPDVEVKKMASSELVRVAASDGLEIPAWLTLPSVSAGERKPYPMVVLVHGGPWVPMPSWRWDAEVQFLASRGYAVLQPQFRGTRGLGYKHFRTSWRQWGRTMQSDVASVTRWAIDKGFADADRIAIAGASYGGYAALMGLVRDPSLYRCAVSWVGVTDLEMLYTVNWSDFSDTFKKFGMPVLVGDRVKDAAELKDNSPLTHAGKISQPLFLAYGSKDVRVPLIHGEAFRKAVLPGNSRVEWVVYPDEGHGWRDPANQVDFYNRMAAFLDKNLRT